jgi:hypothetical protein
MVQLLKHEYLSRVWHHPARVEYAAAAPPEFLGLNWGHNHEVLRVINQD